MIALNRGAFFRPFGPCGCSFISNNLNVFRPSYSPHSQRTATFSASARHRGAPPRGSTRLKAIGSGQPTGGDGKGEERARIVSASGKLVRLERILANRGVGSRLEVAKLIRQGRVRVDSVVVKSGSAKFPDNSRVTFDGREVESLPLLVAYHKAKGILCTLDDEWNRKHLGDVLPDIYLDHMHPVGRLDLDSSGLLLLSSDGTLTHKLLQPKFGVEREYTCVVAPAPGMPPPGDALVDKLAEGVVTTDGVFPGTVTGIEGNTVSLIVKEGKYRMVRRMLANAGYPVEELHRTRYGRIEIGDLEVGQCVPIKGDALDWAVWLLNTPEKVLMRVGPDPGDSIIRSHS